jgi:hypothetical protein
MSNFISQSPSQIFNRHSKEIVKQTIRPERHIRERSLNDDRFYKGLRDGDYRHIPTNMKNSFLGVWSTEPTRRLERSFPKKDMTLLKRSGYNVVID